MNILIHWIVTAVAIVITAYFLPGVHVAGFVAALILAVVLGLINITLKPILLFITLPINVLTLGLFTLVINAVLILFAEALVGGFHVDGFVSAFIFAIILTVVRGVLSFFIDNK